MEITLRPYHPEDQEILFSVYADTRRGEVSAWGWNPAQQDAFLRMQFMAQKRWYDDAYANADHQIICRGGQPAGRILVQRDADCIRLIDIALLGEYRGQGIGSFLLQALLEESAQRVVPLRLQVHRSNTGARRLYTRLGFVQTGEDDVYCQMERSPKLD
ncbi:MAG TPA: GNAT family N-acetyltransferase [Candidatus Angelobacter sp.]|nr:GNAT family N-acetyltransferase [Candidatus Angelobacter sp.]